MDDKSLPAADGNNLEASLIRRSEAYPPIEYVDMPVGEPEDEGSSEGVGDYLRMLRRHKLAIVVLGVFCAGIGMVVAKLPRVPMYSARATIELSGADTPPLGTFNPFAMSFGASAVPTQVMAMQSSGLLGRVVERLRGKYTEDFFYEQSRLWDWLKAQGAPIPDPVVTSGQAISMTRRSLQVAPVGQTQIIELYAESPDPDMAADFINMLIDEYGEQLLESRLEQGRKTTQYLNTQLSDIRKRLEDSQVRLQEYAQESGLMFASGNTTATVAEQRLQQIQGEYLAAQSGRMNAQSVYETYTTVSPEALSNVVDNPTLERLQSSLDNLNAQRAELALTFTPAHSKMKTLQVQIDNIEAQIRKQQENIINRARRDYENATAKELKLEESFAAQSQIVSQQSEQTIQYEILRGEVETNRQLFSSILQQVREASVNSVVQTGGVRTLDPAQPRSIPYQVNPIQSSMLGLLAGLVLGVGYSIVREKADSRLKTPGTISAKIRLTELGVIPSAPQKAVRRILPRRLTSLNLDGRDAVGLLMWKQKDSVLAEAVRAAVTSILFCSNNGRRRNVFVVTSPQIGEGKTTTVANLGIGIAEIGRRVVLIDADMRHPRLHKVFGLSNESGLADILEAEEDGGPRESFARSTEVPNLSVITSGSPKSSISRLLHSEKMASLIRDLRRAYDVVLIDTPPILHLSDARVLGRMADGVVFVFRSGTTSLQSAVAAKERFVDDGITILGSILNDWDPKATGYGRGYYSTYYQNYGKRDDS